MRRVERVADDAALGMPFATLLDVRHGQTRRAGRDNDVRTQHRIELTIQFVLERQTLRTVFLDEIDIGKVVHIGRKRQARLRAARHDGAQRFHRRPRLCDVLAQGFFRARRGIGRHDVEPLSQKQRTPAGSDDPGTDYPDLPNILAHMATRND